MPTVSLPRCFTISRAALPVSEQKLEAPLKQAKSHTFSNFVFCSSTSFGRPFHTPDIWMRLDHATDP